MIRDGYYNYSDNPNDPGCWLVQGDTAFFIARDGTKAFEPRDYVDAKIIRGDFAPSVWLPPGVTVNPAIEPDVKQCPAKDEDPIKPEHREAADRFIMLTAIDIVNTICATAAHAPAEVRVVYHRPSLFDRAVMDKVCDLLA